MPGSEPPAELAGHLRCRCALRPGLSVHADDAVDPCDFTAHGRMDAGLRVLVLLEGAVDVSYGERRLLVAAERPRGPSGLMVNLTQPELFARRLRKGRHARRVCVCLGGTWLAQMATSTREQDAVGEFMRQHLAVKAFAPSPRLAALAGQLAEPARPPHAPGAAPLLHHLTLESRALAFAAEALSGLLAPAGEPALRSPPSLRPRQASRMQDLHDFLQSDAALGLSLQAIAQQVGMHPNTMQRHFRAQYGTTVVDCVRETRLLRARQALEQGGLSVAQAAEMAGYTSAANFATAFRRRFGLPPKWARMGGC